MSSTFKQIPLYLLLLSLSASETESRGVLTLRFLRYQNDRELTYDGKCCDRVADSGASLCTQQCNYVLRLLVTGLGRANDHAFLFHRPVKFSATVDELHRAEPTELTVLFDDWPGEARLYIFFYDYNKVEDSTTLVDRFQMSLLLHQQTGRFQREKVMGKRSHHKTQLWLDWSVMCSLGLSCFRNADTPTTSQKSIVTKLGRNSPKERPINLTPKQQRHLQTKRTSDMVGIRTSASDSSDSRAQTKSPLNRETNRKSLSTESSSLVELTIKNGHKLNRNLLRQIIASRNSSKLKTKATKAGPNDRNYENRSNDYLIKDRGYSSTLRSAGTRKDFPFNNEITKATRTVDTQLSVYERKMHSTSSPPLFQESGQSTLERQEYLDQSGFPTNQSGVSRFSKLPVSETGSGKLHDAERLTAAMLRTSEPDTLEPTPPPNAREKTGASLAKRPGYKWTPTGFREATRKVVKSERRRLVETAAAARAVPVFFSRAAKPTSTPSAAQEVMVEENTALENAYNLTEVWPTSPDKADHPQHRSLGVGDGTTVRSASPTNSDGQYSRHRNSDLPTEQPLASFYSEERGYPKSRSGRENFPSKPAVVTFPRRISTPSDIDGRKSADRRRNYSASTSVSLDSTTLLPAGHLPLLTEISTLTNEEKRNRSKPTVTNLPSTFTINADVSHPANKNGNNLPEVTDDIQSQQKSRLHSTFSIDDQMTVPLIRKGDISSATIGMNKSVIHRQGKAFPSDSRRTEKNDSLAVTKKKIVSSHQDMEHPPWLTLNREIPATTYGKRESSIDNQKEDATSVDNKNEPVTDGEKSNALVNIKKDNRAGEKILNNSSADEERDFVLENNKNDSSVNDARKDAMKNDKTDNRTTSDGKEKRVANDLEGNTLRNYSLTNIAAINIENNKKRNHPDTDEKAAGLIDDKTRALAGTDSTVIGNFMNTKKTTWVSNSVVWTNGFSTEEYLEIARKGKMTANRPIFKRVSNNPEEASTVQPLSDASLMTEFYSRYLSEDSQTSSVQGLRNAQQPNPTQAFDKLEKGLYENRTLPGYLPEQQEQSFTVNSMESSLPAKPGKREIDTTSDDAQIADAISLPVYVTKVSNILTLKNMAPPLPVDTEKKNTNDGTNYDSRVTGNSEASEVTYPLLYPVDKKTDVVQTFPTKTTTTSFPEATDKNKFSTTFDTRSRLNNVHGGITHLSPSYISKRKFTRLRSVIEPSTRKDHLQATQNGENTESLTSYTEITRNKAANDVPSATFVSQYETSALLGLAAEISGTDGDNVKDSDPTEDSSGRRVPTSLTRNGLSKTNENATVLSVLERGENPNHSPAAAGDIAAAKFGGTKSRPQTRVQPRTGSGVPEMTDNRLIGVTNKSDVGLKIRDTAGFATTEAHAGNVTSFTSVSVPHQTGAVPGQSASAVSITSLPGRSSGWTGETRAGPEALPSRVGSPRRTAERKVAVSTTSNEQGPKEPLEMGNSLLNSLQTAAATSYVPGVTSLRPPGRESLGRMGGTNVSTEEGVSTSGESKWTRRVDRSGNKSKTEPRPRDIQNHTRSPSGSRPHDASGRSTFRGDSETAHEHVKSTQQPAVSGLSEPAKTARKRPTVRITLPKWIVFPRNFHDLLRNSSRLSQTDGGTKGKSGDRVEGAKPKRRRPTVGLGEKKLWEPTAGPTRKPVTAGDKKSPPQRVDPVLLLPKSRTHQTVGKNEIVEEDLDAKTVFEKYWPAIMGCVVGTAFVMASILTSVACKRRTRVRRRRIHGRPRAHRYSSQPPLETPGTEYSSGASLFAESIPSSSSSDEPSPTVAEP